MRARDKLIAPLFVLTLILISVAVWKLSGAHLDPLQVRWQVGQQLANALSEPLGLSLQSILSVLVALAGIGGLIVCLRFLRDGEITRLKRCIKDLENAHGEALEKWQREAAQANTERALKQAALHDLQLSQDESERLFTELRAKERLLGRLPAPMLAGELAGVSDGELASTQQRWAALQKLREGDARRLRERDNEVLSLRREILRIQEQTGAAMTARQEERSALEKRWQDQLASLQARIDEQSSVSEIREAEVIALTSKLADHARMERELEEAKSSLVRMTEEKAARAVEAQMAIGPTAEAWRGELEQLRADLSASEEALREKDAELAELKKPRSELPRFGGSGNQLLQAELVQKTRLLEAKDKALRELEERMKEEIGAHSESDTGKKKHRRKAKR